MLELVELAGAAPDTTVGQGSAAGACPALETDPTMAISAQALDERRDISCAGRG
jgi:hypothetical protein